MPDAPKIKFCGLTSLPDAQLAVQAGAWAIGLIFWPQSVTYWIDRPKIDPSKVNIEQRIPDLPPPLDLDPIAPP